MKVLTTDVIIHLVNSFLSNYDKVQLIGVRKLKLKIKDIDEKHFYKLIGLTKMK